ERISPKCFCSRTLNWFPLGDGRAPRKSRPPVRGSECPTWIRPKRFRSGGESKVVSPYRPTHSHEDLISHPANRDSVGDWRIDGGHHRRQSGRLPLEDLCVALLRHH